MGMAGSYKRRRLIQDGQPRLQATQGGLMTLEWWWPSSSALAPVSVKDDQAMTVRIAGQGPASFDSKRAPTLTGEILPFICKLRSVGFEGCDKDAHVCTDPVEGLLI